MSHDLSALLPSAVAIAREAGREIMEVYSQDFSVTHKADSSPLTEADLRSHRMIVKGLTGLTPDIPVLSEESAAIPYAERSTWKEFWLVDPLDGTREFVARNPDFTVNIALVRDGRAVLGVLHIPVQRVSYFAADCPLPSHFATRSLLRESPERPSTDARSSHATRPPLREGGNFPLSCEAGEGQGGGAFRQKEGEAAVRIHTARPAQTPLRVLGSRHHRGTSLDSVLAQLPAHELVAVGSALKFCRVAEGSADFYPRLGPTSEWDTAAGQAIVECAGGCVVDREGNALRYNTRESLLNPEFLVVGDPGRRDLTRLA